MKNILMIFCLVLMSSISSANELPATAPSNAQTKYEDKCAKLGFSAAEWVTLASYFNAKKMAFTIIYFGDQKAQAESYNKGSGGQGKVVAYSSLGLDRSPETCSQLPDGSYAIPYYHSQGGSSASESSLGTN